MHDHDEFSILDLLDAPSLTESEIRSRLDGCDECFEELGAQRSVTEMLAGLPAPVMTDLERRSLRRGVEEELDSTNVVGLPDRSRRARAWDWTRLGTVAAALLGVFVIGGIVTSLPSGDDADAPTTIAVAGESATEQSADSARTTESFAADSAETMDDAAGVDESDAAIASLAPQSAFVSDIGPVDATALEAEIESLGDTIREATDASPLIEGALEGIGSACVGEIEDDAALHGALIAEVEGTQIVVYFDSDGAPSAFSPPDCSPYPLP